MASLHATCACSLSPSKSVLERNARCRCRIGRRFRCASSSSFKQVSWRVQERGVGRVFFKGKASHSHSHSVPAREDSVNVTSPVAQFQVCGNDDSVADFHSRTQLKSADETVESGYELGTSLEHIHLCNKDFISGVSMEIQMAHETSALVKDIRYEDFVSNETHHNHNGALEESETKLELTVELEGRDMTKRDEVVSDARGNNRQLKIQPEGEIVVDLDTSVTVASIPNQNKNHFWNILAKDREVFADGLNWIKEVAVPSFSKQTARIVSLRAWEDPHAAPMNPPSWPQRHYPYLSIVETLNADLNTIKEYYAFVKGWLGLWRIPLQTVYDPETIADYFSLRPHILLIRILEITAAFSLMVIGIELEKIKMKTSSGNMPYEENLQLKEKEAELLKGTLLKLGPTFIKVGQSLSTRPDLVGVETAKVLSDLQDRLPHFPTQDAMAVIEEELECPLNQIFYSLSEEPVAAASFGQVYRGCTIDGQDVAVKVQRPDLLYTVARDIYILRIGLGILQKVAQRRSNLRFYADELGKGLFGELDYREEAVNCEEFKEANSKLQFLMVPTVLKHLTRKRVLTMEWIVGDCPKELLFIALGMYAESTENQRLEARRRLFSLVNKGVEASLVQLLDTGILHADPHPGNLLYTAGGKMVFLDFGLLCRMEKHHQMAMLASVAHIVNADWKGLVNDLEDMEVLRPDINKFMIEIELENALKDDVPKNGLPDIKFSKVLTKILMIALKHQFKMPPYFILVLRSIASLEGLALSVDPEFKVFAASYPYVVQRLLTDRSVPSRKVFLSLVLNEKREFRWDRLASFITLARQHSMKRAALETEAEMQALMSYGSEAMGNETQMITQLIQLLRSRNGVVLRRLVLEADTYALMRSLISGNASSLRRQVADFITGMLYKVGRDFLRSKLNPHLGGSLRLQTPDEPDNKCEFKSIEQICLLKNSSYFVFLIKTVSARLRKAPLLMLRSGLACLSILSYAFFVATHRIIAEVAIELVDDSNMASRVAPQLSPVS